MKVFGNFRINGIYIYVSDMKKDGYDVKDANGNLVHMKYEEPSAWDKMKFKLKFGYSMRTDTIITSYFCFSKYEKEYIYSGAMLGDGISIAKTMKKSLDDNSKVKVQFEDGKIFWIKDDVLTEVSEIDEGKALLESRTDLNTNQKLSGKIYSFVDWEYLH
jgi:hypothetical protein